jgi:hypothetical protein
MFPLREQATGRSAISMARGQNKGNAINRLQRFHRNSCMLLKISAEPKPSMADQWKDGETNDTDTRHDESHFNENGQHWESVSIRV